jgi:glycine reductase
MVKEIERAGIPVVHIATVVPISETVGANRIVPAIAIPHPLGLGHKTAPSAEDKEKELIVRRKIVDTALKALATDIDKQTVFEVK